MIVLPLSLLAVGCKQKEAPQASAINVKVVEVQPRAAAGGQLFSGTVEESVGTMLSFPVAGTVQQVAVSEGQRVAKGTMVAQLDLSTLQNAYDASAAMLDQAQDAYERMRQLHDNGSLPEIQWVEVQSKLRQAQSSERIARKSLADGRLYAPFAGVIAQKSVEAGQNVLPGQQIVKLVAIGDVKVTISVPEDEIAAIAKGQTVIVTVPALGGKTFTGRITEKGVAASTLSRCYEVRALVANPDGELLPGMICEMSVSKDAGREAIVLPASVVQLGDKGEHFVWTTVKGKAHRSVVTTGELTPQGVTVTHGLTAGDHVVTEGAQKISEGMAVTVVK